MELRDLCSCRELERNAPEAASELLSRLLNLPTFGLPGPDCQIIVAMPPLTSDRPAVDRSKEDDKEPVVVKCKIGLIL